MIGSFCSPLLYSFEIQDKLSLNTGQGSSCQYIKQLSFLEDLAGFPCETIILQNRSSALLVVYCHIPKCGHFRQPASSLMAEMAFCAWLGQLRTMSCFSCCPVLLLLISLRSTLGMNKRPLQISKALMLATCQMLMCNACIAAACTYRQFRASKHTLWSDCPPRKCLWNLYTTFINVISISSREWTSWSSESL